MSHHQSQSDSNDSACQDLETEGKFKWSSDAIKKLLKLRFEMSPQFANPPGKKILLWNEISEELKKNNYNVSGKLCFAKFRNLTASYRRRKELGDSYCHWEYMDIMDSFFNDAHPSSFVLESDNTLDQTYVSSAPEGEEATHSIYIVQNIDEEEMEQDEEHVEEEQVMEEYEEEEQEEQQTTTLEQQEEQQDEEEGEEEFHWSPIAVNLLLNLRFQRNHAFSLPHSQTKKAELWNDISREMIKNNFNIPGHVCDTKYRRLLKTYRLNKARREQGVSGNTWIHFDLMDAYLGDTDSKGNYNGPLDDQNQSIEATGSASNALYTLIQDTVEEESHGSSHIKGAKDGFQWTPDAIKLFLKLRFDRQNQFLDPFSKKFKLWEEIGNAMQKNGYSISGHGCDNKFRNLLTTYRTVKRKIGSGDRFVRWRYYEDFDRYYKHEVFPAKTLSINPTRSVSLNHVVNISDQQDEEEEEEGDNDEDEGHNQRKKPKMTINRYLQFKMKAEEKKRKDFLALEERKLKLEYKKLEIEQKKIEVFKSLVAALKQGKKNS
ncbi:hypothetical protein WDU94_015273 [Cyamophila willieti]